MTAHSQKPHCSPSQLTLMSRCPEAYRRRYVEGEKIPPGIAMLKGTGVHGGARVNFQQKIESHRDLPVAEIVEAAVATFELELHGGYTIDEGNPKLVIAEAKDGVAVLAELHGAEVAPDYQPVLVEQSFRIGLPGPVDLLGIIDLADDRRRVVDHKTSGKKKPQSEADTSIQLTAYAAGHRILTGEPATEVRLEVLVDKAAPERQTLSSDRGEADFEALAHRINAFSHAIQSGSFPPTTPDNWMCAKKWCGFWSTCRFVNHSRPTVSLPAKSDDRAALRDAAIAGGASTVLPDGICALDPAAEEGSRPIRKRAPKNKALTAPALKEPIAIQSSSGGGRPGPFVRKQRPKMKLKSE